MAQRARQRCHALLTGLVALASAAVLSTATPAQAADTWTEVGSDRADPLTESQGLTSVEVPANSANRYTGIGTIPLSVRNRGWNHVGDPDASYDGYYIEPYQADSGSAKMFRVQAPGGGWSEYVHALGPGEALNNSFVAISPGGQWMVSGEWGTMTRLLVHPTPGVNPSTSPSANLPWTSSIRLDRPVRDVQGCDFRDATTLLTRYVDDGKIAGAVAAVARRGKLAYFEDVGFRDLASRAPMTERSLYRIKSMTKPDTAVAAMKLQEDGRFKLDDP